VERGGKWDVLECLSGLGIGELEASVTSVGGGSSDRSTISFSVREAILEVEMNVRCGGGRSRLRSLLVPITIIAIVVVAIIVIVVSVIAIISIIVVVIATTSVTSTRVTDNRIQLLSIGNLTLRMSRARARWGG
jgi:hypothetical protein